MFKLFGRKNNDNRVNVEKLEANLANASRLRQEMYTQSIMFTTATDKMIANSRKEVKRA